MSACRFFLFSVHDNVIRATPRCEAGTRTAAARGSAKRNKARTRESAKPKRQGQAVQTAKHKREDKENGEVHPPRAFPRGDACHATSTTRPGRDATRTGPRTTVAPLGRAAARLPPPPPRTETNHLGSKRPLRVVAAHRRAHRSLKARIDPDELSDRCSLHAHSTPRVSVCVCRRIPP